MSGQTKLRVKIITWNLGDNRLTQDEWLSEIKKSWSIIMVRDYDVLGVCLQEDWRGAYGKLADAIALILKDEFIVASDSVEGPPEITKLSFSVRAYLYLRKKIFINPIIKTQDTCLSRAVYCTKSSAGVSTIIPMPGGKIIQITLISSHLPINNKKDDLGYAERVVAVKKTFDEVYDKLVDTTVPMRLAFWGGDLNFRDNTPIQAGGPPMKDQLLYLFSVRPSSFFREFEEPAVEFPPTCKMVSCDKKNCPVCRNRSGTTLNPTCYVEEGKHGVARVPSHCDRILYRSDGVDGEIVNYTSWGGSRAIQGSDHNLVTLTVDVMF